MCIIQPTWSKATGSEFYEHFACKCFHENIATRIPLSDVECFRKLWIILRTCRCWRFFEANDENCQPGQSLVTVPLEKAPLGFLSPLPWQKNNDKLLGKRAHGLRLLPCSIHPCVSCEIGRAAILREREQGHWRSGNREFPKRPLNYKVPAGKCGFSQDDNYCN